MNEDNVEKPKVEEKPRRQPVRPPAPDRFKAEALKRLQKLEGRGPTVGTQLDELRAIVTEIVQRMRG